MRVMRPLTAVLAKPGAVSALEQIVLSGLSLVISVILLAGAGKQLYGQFAVINSYLLLFLGVQTAVISVPLSVELSRDGGGDVAAELATVAFATLPIFAVLAAAGGLALQMFQHAPNGKVAWAFGAAIFGGAMREFCRSVMVVERKLPLSLSSSAVYALLTLCGLAGAYLLRAGFEIADVFWVLGLAGILTSVPTVWTLGRKAGRTPAWGVLPRLLTHSRWAVPGVLTIWVQNNAYLTVISQRFGHGAAGELAAARLLVMPYLTVMSGYLRPVAAAWSRGEPHLAARLQRMWCRQLVVGGLLALTLAVAAWAFAHWQLRPEWVGVLMAGSLWAVFAGVSSARGVLTSVAHGQRKFRLLFLFNLACTGLVLALLLACTWSTLPALSVLALTAGEALLLLLLLRSVGPALRRPLGRDS